MATFKAGIIGCGGRGRSHARGYQVSPDVDIVACSDPAEDARNAFAEAFEVPNTYENYQEMLDTESLDFVSVCTWIELHKDMVIAAANSGIRAIHCEKPMSPTWGDAKTLYQACVDNNVVITFCHQRRFGAQFVKAKRLANEGAIGELRRLEASCPNLLDWGTHWFDMFFFYNNDEPVDWVMGQIDVVEEKTVFGVQVETSGISWIRWKNGVEGLLATGDAGMSGFANRLIGTKGIIDVGGRGIPIRMLREGGTGWEEPDLTGLVAERDATILSVLDLIHGIKTGREPELSGRKSIQATELIFATYQSSRQRARINLPLTVDDSALLTMVANGDVG